jgi:hypothetical protein
MGKRMPSGAKTTNDSKGVNFAIQYDPFKHTKYPYTHTRIYIRYDTNILTSRLLKARSHSISISCFFNDNIYDSLVMYGTTQQSTINLMPCTFAFKQKVILFIF